MSELTSYEIQTIREKLEGTSFDLAYVKGDPWKGYEVRNEGNGMVIAETSSESDAEFIAEASIDILKLLAEVERLNAVLDEEISEKEHVIMAQQMEIERLYSKLNGGDA